MTNLRRELKDLLKDVEQHGWRATRIKKYYACWCPCPEKHKTWVHLTPGDPNHYRNKLAWLQRQPCWEKK